MKTRKQPATKPAPQVAKKAGNAVERQVESRVTHSYLKEDEYDVSRLDLIFRSEPQQIQQKLMKLLISYNAHMQYNHQTDMFEVDLLLPFLNEQQKRQFVKQFLEIRKQKQIVTPVPQIQVEDRDSEVREPVSSQPSSKSKDKRRFSFNIKEQEDDYSGFYKKEDEMLDQLNYEQQIIDKQVGKILFVQEKDRTAEFKQININETPQSKKPPPIDLHEVALMFDQKLKSAISIINRRKGKDQINKQNIEAAKSAPEEEVHKKEEDSIIYQLSAGNSSFNNTKNMSNSEYIREDLGDQEELFEGKEESREEHSHNTHDYRYQQIIEEQEEYDDYQPLFQPIPVPVSKTKIDKKEKNVTSFQQYTKKYTSVKQQKVKSKAKPEPKLAVAKRTNPRNVGNQNNQVQVDVSRNYYSSKQRPSEASTTNHLQQRKSLKSIGDKSPIRSGSREQQEREKQGSRDHSKSSEKGSIKQSRSRKPNFNEFFTAHRQHLQKIYSRIRGNISMGKQQNKKQQQRVEEPARQSEYYSEPPPKAADDMYILVLDQLQQQPDMTQNQSTMEALNNEQFKDEIMKDYEKEILVSNRNLSSQDLIRYFKFLHSNAKKLYLKFLKSNKK